MTANQIVVRIDAKVPPSIKRDLERARAGLEALRMTFEARRIVGEILKARAEECLGYRLERAPHWWWGTDPGIGQPLTPELMARLKKHIGQPYRWNTMLDDRPIGSRRGTG